jgi:hypothetical protein
VNLLVNLAMVAGGVTALAGLLTPPARRLLRIEHGLRTVCRVVLGTPAGDGEPARPGVIERLDTQDAELAAIKAQLASMKDSTARGRA